ncbi:MAG: hypothetical protein DRQ52_11520, partial [Gammaproteobacteria bacterium]
MMNNYRLEQTPITFLNIIVIGILSSQVNMVNDSADFIKDSSLPVDRLPYKIDSNYPTSIPESALSTDVSLTEIDSAFEDALVGFYTRMANAQEPL